MKIKKRLIKFLNFTLNSHGYLFMDTDKIKIYEPDKKEVNDTNVFYSSETKVELDREHYEQLIDRIEELEKPVKR